MHARKVIVKADPARPLPEGCQHLHLHPLCILTSQRREFVALHGVRELASSALKLSILNPNLYHKLYKRAPPEARIQEAVAGWRRRGWLNASQVGPAT